MTKAISIAILANASKARSEINSVADTAEKSTGRLRGSIGKAGKFLAVGLGAGLVGAAAAGVKFAQAAIEDEQSAARMAQTFTKAAGATKKQISATEDWITAQGKAKGVADDDLRPALSRLVTATGDVGKAQKLASLAMDVSAGTGKSLEQVSTALMKAQNGQVSSLSRLGINTKDAEGKTISMAEATKRMADTFGGAAQANADTLGGRVERLKLMASEAGESIGAKMLPPLTAFAGWVISTGVPAVTAIAQRVQAWAATMADRLAPVAANVATFVTGTLVPAITAFANYVITTVVPAVVAFATKIATNLAPVAVALAGHVQRVIAKFREWAPTIQAVIAVVAKIVAKVLEFASVILGTVLPPLIRFASVMVVTFVGAVVDAIGVVGRIISKVIDFGGSVVDGARKVGEFAGKVQEKVADVVTYFTELPEKIKTALSGAKDLLVDVGKNIVQGLVNGIDSAKQWVIDKVQDLADLVPGWVKKRLGIASPSKVTTYLGEMAGQGFADGIASTREKVRQSTQKVIDAIKERLERAKGVRESILSLRESIASTLSGDLFSGTGDEASTALDKFRASLAAAKATADQVAAAVRKLIDAKVSKGFLQNLLQSGNTELIVQLAGAPDIKTLAAQYDAVIKENEATSQLVAEQVVGRRLDLVNQTMKELRGDLARREERDREDSKKPITVKIDLGGDALSDIERGRRYQRDLDAYRDSGGRQSA